MIGLVGPAYILFSLCCIQCHEVQHMLGIPPTVSEEQLPLVQVTPYHPHNSVNLPRHLPDSTLHLLLGGDGSGHLYIHYTTMVTTGPWQIPFEQRNVIDHELPHCTINSCSSHARVLGKTLVNKFHFSYRHTQWYFLFLTVQLQMHNVYSEQKIRNS